MQILRAALKSVSSKDYHLYIQLIQMEYTFRLRLFQRSQTNIIFPLTSHLLTLPETQHFHLYLILDFILQLLKILLVVVVRIKTGLLEVTFQMNVQILVHKSSVSVFTQLFETKRKPYRKRELKDFSSLSYMYHNIIIQYYQVEKYSYLL